MSLYHATFDKKVTAPSLYKLDHLVKLRKVLKDVSHEKMIRIFDERIADIQPSQSSQLYFASLAILVGHGCQGPTCDTNYVWRMVTRVADPSQQRTKVAEEQAKKAVNITLGVFAQWRFVLDERDWIAVTQKTGKVNYFGEDITQTSYFIATM